MEGRMIPLGGGLEPNHDILYSSVCLSMSSSSFVKCRSTEMALMSWKASASLDDMNFSTTCLRYSKLISLVSVRSELLVTVVLEVMGGGPEV